MAACKKLSSEVPMMSTGRRRVPHSWMPMTGLMTPDAGRWSHVPMMMVMMAPMMKMAGRRRYSAWRACRRRAWQEDTGRANRDAEASTSLRTGYTQQHQGHDCKYKSLDIIFLHNRRHRLLYTCKAQQRAPIVHAAGKKCIFYYLRRRKRPVRNCNSGTRKTTQETA